MPTNKYASYCPFCNLNERKRTNSEQLRTKPGILETKVKGARGFGEECIIYACSLGQHCSVLEIYSSLKYQSETVKELEDHHAIIGGPRSS